MNNTVKNFVVNVTLHMFGECFLIVKKPLFREYCSKVYCCSLWSVYLHNFNKIEVMYHNVFGWMTDLKYAYAYALPCTG